MEIIERAAFRVTRDGDTEISDDADDLLEAVESELRQAPLRRRRAARGLELDLARDARAADGAASRVATRTPSTRSTGCSTSREVMQLYEPRPPRPEVRAVGAAARSAASRSRRTATCSPRSRRGDIVVQHPYDSFATSVEAFVRAAAKDPAVATLKTTVYRTSHDSALAPALIEAAENGKQSVCIVELKARFDERAQHRVGALARAGRRPRRLRLPRPEDPREDDARDPPRGRRAAALRPHRHRQLPRDDRADLRGRRPLHRRPGHRRRRRRPVQLRHRLRSPAARSARSSSRPFNLRTRARRAHPQRRRRRGGRRARARIRIKVNNLTDPGIVEELYTASQAGREDRPDRARGLHAAARRRGAERADPRALDPRPLPRAQPPLLLRGRRRSDLPARQRRPDAAQPRPPDRDRRAGRGPARAGRDRDDLPPAPHRQLAGVDADPGRHRGPACGPRTASGGAPRSSSRCGVACGRIAAARRALEQSERSCRQVASASWGVPVGVIDVGSNTVRLHVSRDGRELHREKAMLRLGEAIERHGLDSPRRSSPRRRSCVASFAADARVRGVGPARGARHEPGPPGRERRRAARAPRRRSRCTGAAALGRGGGPPRVPRRARRRARVGSQAPDRGVRRRRRLGAGRGRHAPEGAAWVRSIDIGSMRLTSRLLDDDPPGDAAVSRARPRSSGCSRGSCRPCRTRRSPSAAAPARCAPIVGSELGADELDEVAGILARTPASEIVELYGIEPEPRSHAGGRRGHPRRDPRAPARPASRRARRRPRGRRARARRTARSCLSLKGGGRQRARPRPSPLAGRHAPSSAGRARARRSAPPQAATSSTARARTRASATTASWCAPIRSCTSLSASRGR